MKRSRVGVFGASLDPPTNQSGHTGIVEYFSSIFDEVWIVPVYEHPYSSLPGSALSKRCVAPFDSRVEMAKIAFENKAAGNILVSTVERDFYLLRKSNPEIRDASFGTYMLLQHLRIVYPDIEFYLILGMDTFNNLCAGKWRNHEALLADTYICVIERVGTPPIMSNIENLTKRGIEMFQISTLTSTSSSAVRKLLRSKVNENLLREQLKPFVDDAVVDYILSHRLYDAVPM